jgi:hypothetical protein
LQRSYTNQALILKDWGRLEEAFALFKKGDREKPGAEITAQNGNAHGPHGVTRKHVFSDKNVNQILAFVLIQSYFKTSFRYGRIAFKSLTAEEVQRQQMNIIALIDTKPELPRGDYWHGHQHSFHDR